MPNQANFFRRRFSCAGTARPASAAPRGLATAAVAVASLLAAAAHFGGCSPCTFLYSALVSKPSRSPGVGMKAAPSALRDLAAQFSGMVKAPPAKPTATPRAAPKTEVDLSDQTTFKVGVEVTGEVEKIIGSGAIIRFSESVTGFLHNSEIRAGFVKDASQFLSPGDPVKVKVIKNEPGFMGVSKKKVGTKSLQDFEPGDEVKGKVIRVENYGAFLDIGADFDCLLHKSQIKEGTFVSDAREYFQVGDQVTTYVRRISGKKLELTSKQMFAFPLQQGIKLKDLEPGQELGGVVHSAGSMGVFVDIGSDEGRGMIHNRNINDGIFANVQDLLKVGDTVMVSVLQVLNGKLELELESDLKRLPPVDSFGYIPNEQWLEGYVADVRPDYGAIVTVQAPQDDFKVNGLLHKRHMKAGTEVFLMQEIKVRVHDVDKERRQVAFTMHEAAFEGRQKRIRDRKKQQKRE